MKKNDYVTWTQIRGILIAGLLITMIIYLVLIPAFNLTNQTFIQEPRCELIGKQINQNFSSCYVKTKDYFESPITNFECICYGFGQKTLEILI